MTEFYPTNNSDLPTTNISACGKPQQEPVSARLAAVAPPGSCGVQSATISPTISATRILRLPELLTRLGICRASIYLHIAQGTFPKQISLGLRAVGWLESEVDAWLAARMTARETERK